MHRRSWTNYFAIFLAASISLQSCLAVCECSFEHWLSGQAAQRLTCCSDNTEHADTGAEQDAHYPLHAHVHDGHIYVHSHRSFVGCEDQSQPSIRHAHRCFQVISQPVGALQVREFNDHQLKPALKTAMTLSVVAGSEHDGSISSQLFVLDDSPRDRFAVSLRAHRQLFQV